MSRIINNTEITFSPEAQNSIRNAAANCGVDVVEAKMANFRSNAENLFDFYGEDGEYLFSYDTDADVIYQN